MEGIIIRDVRHSDKFEYLSMARDLFSSNATVCDYNEDIAVSNFNSAVSGSKFCRCLMLEYNSNVAGYAFLAYSYSTSLGGVCIFLEDLYIKEFARGVGVGRCFIKWLLKEYKSIAKVVKLEVTQANVGGMKFYKKLHFKDSGYIGMSLKL